MSFPAAPAPEAVEDAAAPATAVGTDEMRASAESSRCAASATFSLQTP